MVRNALQICADLHRGDNLSHIGCDRVKPKQQVDPVLVDLLLKNVDLFVICDHLVAKLAITIEQRFDCGLKVLVCKARHH